MKFQTVPLTAFLVFAVLACSPSDGQSDATGVGTTEIEAPAPAAAPAPVSAESSDEPQILITNVDVFDGFATSVTKGMHVLVQGNVIKQVSSSPISAPKAQVIDGTGKTMTPGLIDMHQHVMLNAPEGTASYQTQWDDAAGGAFAIHHMNENMLQKGITTVRDIAGDPLDLAKAIQMGLLPGSA
jgi:imidazolonepropionase-like amidohydrolase